MRFAYLLPPILLLAACGQEEEKKAGPEISINAGDEHGGVQISSSKDGGGKVKIGGDGVDIDIEVPDFVDFDVTGDFDIDGVKLYPGSQVTTVNVDATDKNGADKAVVKLGFISPAAPAKAADWMAGEFAKKSIKVTRTGDTLAGKDKDGADFTIKFGPHGANSKGEVLITKS
ncbi:MULTISPECIES: hypothetical protein [unclassified Sphingopyxis]|uniref:hypothetical protein n=1 Tax=unclassified Sphingopyxis TaxID=2614943 RepID=UPI000736A173|nr:MULTISPECIES: hypothetical protein [unclassified Sphingopyxis]KTE46562.1 hypothetical protein ATE62_01055 [Sphingopyxis sp. HIX]KTE85716.1 hypothetical protein ATE72_01780 [Sphingopyxis sp. HXXIV]